MSTWLLVCSTFFCVLFNVGSRNDFHCFFWDFLHFNAQKKKKKKKVWMLWQYTSWLSSSSFFFTCFFSKYSAINTQPPSTHSHKLPPPPPRLSWDPHRSLVRGLQSQNAGNHSCALPPFSLFETKCMFLSLYLHLGEDLGQGVCFSLWMPVFVSQSLSHPVYLAVTTLLSVPISSRHKFPEQLKPSLHGLINSLCSRAVRRCSS